MTHDLVVQEGHTYVGYLWFQNDIAPNVTQSTINAHASLQFPGYVLGSTTADATLSAANTVPHKVWASMGISTGDPRRELEIDPAKGSAKLNVGGRANGTRISWADLTSDQGALVGCDAQDGALPGDSRCAGSIEFQFTVTTPSISVEPTVFGGSGQSFSTKSGKDETLDTRVTNRTDDPMTEITMSTRLPSGISFVDNVWIRRSDPSGDQQDWIRAATNDYGITGNLLFVHLARSDPLVPHGAIDVSFHVLIGDAATACGGSWQKIKNWAQHDDVTVESDLIASIDGTC
ncbi:hypothetical protein [Microbacterium capsulatum]|uniref:Uncharacterized protein n=1 Tax=Microbacterium capsulatum TaxID=3041921 RepID=A0ABU0XHW8_9MICO|nr:hypothetical protein [Microbacterium sp. ASV81]MDQ4213735.1 hypothetical protein [Microbacterium sp. ASV81]